MSFDIDDDDREQFYRQYGKPEPVSRLAAFRRSRSRTWIGIAAFVVACLLFLWPRPKKDDVDWSKYAYSLYATDSHSLCNAVMVFEALHRLGSKAERVLTYPQQWDTEVDSSKDRGSQLLQRARALYNVQLNPVEIIGVEAPKTLGALKAQADWDASVTKLLAWELTYYNRIIQLDGDITLLQNLDELFFLPSAPVAMPRAYWSNVPPATWEGGRAWPMTSLLVLLEPNIRELKYMLETFNNWRSDPDFMNHKKYDMDLLNHRYSDSAMVLPHRPYALLSAEFRNDDHSAYLGTPDVLTHWDAEAALKEAKIVHFSDWPLPKPWIMWPADGLMEIQPKCHGEEGECVERRIWKELYEDFRLRRKNICRLLSVPAPKWDDWKRLHGAGGANVTAEVPDVQLV